MLYMRKSLNESADLWIMKSLNENVDLAVPQATGVERHFKTYHEHAWKEPHYFH